MHFGLIGMDIESGGSIYILRAAVYDLFTAYNAKHMLTQHY